MSFVLPGNNRQLRFTSGADAFAPKEDPNAMTGASPSIALGKPRVRKTTNPPPPSASTSTQPSARSQRSNTATPASPMSRVHTPIPGGSYTPAPSIRAKGGQGGHDIEEDQATMALDRDAFDVMPGGMNGHARSSRPPTGAGVGAAAIPHFRPANAAAQTVVAPGAGSETRRGAPLALWLFAAVLAGVLSYFVTPMAMSHFETPPAKIAADLR